MRAFLLVTTMMVAMVATVSCQQPIISFPISVACNTSTTALDTPTVNLAESYIIREGCTKIDFDITNLRACDDNGNGEYTCYCVSSISNITSWNSAVRNISSTARTCYITLSITLNGTRTVNNQTSPFKVTTTQEAFHFMAVGGECNKTEIEGALLTPFATEGIGFVDSSLNANSNVTGVTWSDASVKVASCGGSRTVTKVISSSGSTTVAPTPINPTPTTSATTTPPTSSGSGSNSSSSSSSSGLPTGTPTSSSSSSSTAGGGNGNGNGNGASGSVMAYSATGIVALCAAVAVIITA